MFMLLIEHRNFLLQIDICLLQVGSVLTKLFHKCAVPSFGGVRHKMFVCNGVCHSGFPFYYLLLNYMSVSGDFNLIYKPEKCLTI